MRTRSITGAQRGARTRRKRPRPRSAVREGEAKAMSVLCVERAHRPAVLVGGGAIMTSRHHHIAIRRRIDTDIDIHRRRPRPNVAAVDHRATVQVSTASDLKGNAAGLEVANLLD